MQYQRHLSDTYRPTIHPTNTCAYMAFETCGNVINRRIEKGNVKWQRCQKALTEGYAISMGDIQISQIERLELVDAYKIENGIILKDFEIKLRKQKESFLKGLFILVPKSQLQNLVLFGFQNQKDSQNQEQLYRDKYLRIPQTYLKNNQSVIEKMLGDQNQNPDKLIRHYGDVFQAYTSPNQINELKQKLLKDLKKDKDISFFSVILCRVIVIDQNNPQSLTFFNQKSQCYELRDYTCIYPEYVMLTRGVKRLMGANIGDLTQNNSVTQMLQNQYQIQQQVIPQQQTVSSENKLLDKLKSNNEILFNLQTQLNFKIQNFWQRLKQTELKQMQMRLMSEREKQISQSMQEQNIKLQKQYNSQVQQTGELNLIRDSKLNVQQKN
eukprot:403372557